jgi:hypothetical protein
LHRHRTLLSDEVYPHNDPDVLANPRSLGYSDFSLEPFGLGKWLGTVNAITLSATPVTRNVKDLGQGHSQGNEFGGRLQTSRFFRDQDKREPWRNELKRLRSRKPPRELPSNVLEMLAPFPRRILNGSL